MIFQVQVRNVSNKYRLDFSLLDVYFFSVYFIDCQKKLFLINLKLMEEIVCEVGNLVSLEWWDMDDYVGVVKSIDMV